MAHISGRSAAHATALALLGSGSLNFGLRIVDAVSRWETVVGLTRYAGFALSPVFGICVVFSGLAIIYWLARKEVEALRQSSLLDASEKPIVREVNLRWIKRVAIICALAFITALPVSFGIYKWLPVTGTMLSISLEPSENEEINGIKQPQGPPPNGAYIRVGNNSDETDKNIYIRLNGPPIYQVFVENKERMRVLGSFPPKQLMMYSGTDLELFLPELLPGETRAAHIDVYQRNVRWVASMRSDLVPSRLESEFSWPRAKDEHTSRRIAIFRMGIKVSGPFPVDDGREKR